MHLRRLLFPKAIDTIGSTNKSERDHWIREVLTALPEGNLILDAGAGKMPYKKYCTHLHYTSQDFCQYDGIGNKAGLQTQSFDTSQIDIVSDITSIPLPDNHFDVILCSEVLEHVPDPVRAIHELIRLLKPGGKLIVTVPFCSLTHYAPYHFATGFNRYFFESFSEKLDIQVLNCNGNYFEYLAQEVKRVPEVAHRYAGFKFGWLSRLITYAYLTFLNKAATGAAKSEELLCFGYHCLAVKKTN